MKNKLKGYLFLLLAITFPYIQIFLHHYLMVNYPWISDAGYRSTLGAMQFVIMLFVFVGCTIRGLYLIFNE